MKKGGNVREHKKSSRRWYRNHKKQMLSTITVILCSVCILILWFYQAQKRQQEMQIKAVNTHDTGSGYRDIFYEGKHYRYNSLIKTVLYAGVDGTGKMAQTLQYGNKARADVVSLVIMDKKHKRMTILPISRDTITDVRRYSMNGNDNGLYTTHLGYAYSYGDGGKISCENLCESVSNLLGGIPVKEYVVTNRNSMPYINDLVGGITLTIPNSDLENKYPELAEGTEVTLSDKNISDFLQYRNTEEDFSNDGRMERQKAYVTAYIKKVRQMDSTAINEIWESLEDMEDYLQTSITRNQYLDLADLLKTTEFSEESFVSIEGDNRAGKLYDEFHPDAEALRKLVVELFYDEV